MISSTHLFFLPLPNTPYIMRDHPITPMQSASWTKDLTVDQYLLKVSPIVHKLSIMLGEVGMNLRITLEGRLPEDLNDFEKIVRQLYVAAEKYDNLSLGLSLLPFDLMGLHSNLEYIQYISRAIDDVTIVHEGAYNENTRIFAESRADHTKIESALANMLAFQPGSLVKVPVALFNISSLLDTIIYMNKLEVAHTFYLDLNERYFVTDREISRDLVSDLFDSVASGLQEIEKTLVNIDIAKIIHKLYESLLIKPHMLFSMNITPFGVQGRYLEDVQIVRKDTNYIEYFQEVHGKTSQYIQETMKGNEAFIVSGSFEEGFPYKELVRTPKTTIPHLLYTMILTAWRKTLA
jgi:hypothetical protein